MLQNQIIKKILYTLKLQYREIVDIYTPGSMSTDIGLGVQTVPYTVVRCKKAIVLEGKTSILAKYSKREQVASAPTLTGGYMNTGDRVFIFDVNELPKNFVVQMQQYIVFNHMRYEIKEVSIFGNGLAFIAIGTETKTLPPKEIHNLSVYDYVILAESVIT